MKQRRLSNIEKTELFSKYETGLFTAVDLAKEYPISPVAINALLRRHGYKSKSQSELQRKYNIDETFFDVIDSEEKAYIIGLLYADGCNYTKKNLVILGLKEEDKDILEKISILIGSTKPLQYRKIKIPNHSNQYCLNIQNKHISEKLCEYGVVPRKTFNLKFPTNKKISEKLQRHFVRGYFDGDGYVGKQTICIVGTNKFCNSLSDLLKKELGINSRLRARHPERKNNIGMMEISGGKQTRIFLKWIYEDSKIYLNRKYQKYLEHLEYEKSLNEIRICSIDGCNKKHFSCGFCRNHYYQFCGGKVKRRIRYEKTGK